MCAALCVELYPASKYPDRQEKEIVREQEWLAGLTYDEIDVDAKLLTIKKVMMHCRKDVERYL